MKRKSKDEKADEVRPQYGLAELLKHDVQGKYAKRYSEGTNLVLLDPNLARAFPSDEAVNEALCLVIQLTKLPSGGSKIRQRLIQQAEGGEQNAPVR